MNHTHGKCYRIVSLIICTLLNSLDAVAWGASILCIVYLLYQTLGMTPISRAAGTSHRTMAFCFSGSPYFFKQSDDLTISHLRFCFVGIRLFRHHLIQHLIGRPESDNLHHGFTHLLGCEGDDLLTYLLVDFLLVHVVSFHLKVSHLHGTTHIH